MRRTIPAPASSIRRRWGSCLTLAGGIWLLTSLSAVGSAPLPEVARQVLPKIVKIYGAGGIRGLEAYQSGFLISDQGHILTAWSYVLDADPVLAVLDDGRRFPAELTGADPRSELAVLKIDAQDVPYFDLQQVAQAQTGDRILAFSNLYGIATGSEPVSVLHGFVSAVTQLSAPVVSTPQPTMARSTSWTP